MTYHFATEPGAATIWQGYDHLGFVPIGESVDEWEVEAADGSPCLHHAICIEMLKELPDL